MTDIKQISASADHVWEKYTFQDELFTAYKDAFNDEWYVSDGRLGCSKSRATPEQALEQMLIEHGCSNIKIQEKS